MTYFAHCQSLACVAVQCARNSTAEWRWIEGGVNDLTEDSVELTPYTVQTICSVHQKRKKKRQQGANEKINYKTRVRLFVSGWALITVWTQDAAITVHSIAVLKRWLVRPSGSRSFCNFWCVWRTTVVPLPALITRSAEKKCIFTLPCAYVLFVCFFAEVGKNINQDLSLRMKRFVEDYHKYAQSLNIPTPRPKTPDHQREGQRAKYREGNFYRGSQEAQ